MLGMEPEAHKLMRCFVLSEELWSTWVFDVCVEQEALEHMNAYIYVEHEALKHMKR